MDKKIVFSETQRFNQGWLWLIFLGLNAVFMFLLFQQLKGDEGLGAQLMKNVALLVAMGFVFLLSILFFNFRLETRIQTDGLYVRFFPFHRSFRHYSWDKIDKNYIRKYSPVREYGGWGIRTGQKGEAFNISGNQGLQLEFKDHGRLLIGTNRPEELSAALNKIGQLAL
jgi:hypothetical protein